MRKRIADNGIGQIFESKFVFIPNKRTNQIEIPFSEVEDVQKYTTLFFFNTGVKFILRNKKEERFIMEEDKREIYLEAIKSCIEKTKA